MMLTNSPFEQGKISDADRVLFARDEIELLHEQIEYLNLELLYKNQQVQELQEELNQTNHELGDALIGELSTFDEAKEFAKTLVESEMPVKEALAQILATIYHSVIKPWQLLNMQTALVNDSPSQPIDLEIFEIEANTCIVNSRDLRTGLVALKEQLAMLKARCRQIKVGASRICKKGR